MTDTPRITAASWIMVATLGLTWGGTFLFMELALRGFTPFWLASGRVIFASLVMTAVWGMMGFKLFDGPASKGNWINLCIIAALSSAVPFTLLGWGQQYVTSGFAGVSMAAVALIVLPLAHFFVPGEALNLRKVIGFVIGFIGVVILIGAQAFETTGNDLEALGRVACLGTAVCYAISSILLRRLPAVDPIGLATVLLLIGALFIVPVAIYIEGWPDSPPAESWAVLAFLGLVPTAAANVLRVLVVRSAGPVFMSLVNYQVPVWSVVLGAYFLNEPLPPSLIGALGLILAGVALSQFGALKRLFG